MRSSSERSALDDPAHPRPQLVGYDAARVGEDPRLSLEAAGLAAIAGAVPFTIAVFHAVSPALAIEDGVIAQGDEYTVEAAHEWPRYVREFSGSDPFAPWSAYGTGETVLRLDDVGRPQFEQTRYGQYLESLRVPERITVYLRDEGRIVAGVGLLRARSVPQFSRADASRLRALQPLLEDAYRAAPPGPEALDLLTPREAEVVGLVGMGASNAEIAQALHVGLPTVKTHLVHIYAKLGVTSRTRLALVADRLR